MVAEYERAKILERCRRGRLHAARRGSLSALGRAPYGYRYVRKGEGAGVARYEVIAEQAQVVRQIFGWVGRERVSIGEVCRRLRRHGVPTPSGRSIWQPASVWNILRNPAYHGQAAFGRRQRCDRQAPRPARGQYHAFRPKSSTVRVSSDNWISIPVPPLVSEDLFASVQEQLRENQKLSRLRPQGARYLLQGLLICQHCGHALCGVTARSSHRQSWQRQYYRCLGSDSWRRQGTRRCCMRAIDMDALDNAVWEDVVALLREPQRVQAEYERRL